MFLNRHVLPFMMSLCLLTSCKNPESENPQNNQQSHQNDSQTDTTNPQENQTIKHCYDNFTETSDSCTETNGDIVFNQKCDHLWDEQCDNNVAKFCGEDGFITHRYCDNIPETSCQKMLDENLVDCVKSCSKFNFTPYSTCEGDYVAVHSCEKVISNGTNVQYFDFSYTDKPCQYGCMDGKCLEKPLPKEGVACNSDTFSSLCYGNSYFACENGFTVKYSCESDLECAIPFGSTVPQCTVACKEGKVEERFACNGNALDNYVCSMSTNNGYYIFHDTKECDKNCFNGVCDISYIPVENDPCNPEEIPDLCINNTLYYCSTETETIIAKACKAMPLCRYQSPNYADCVAPCSPDDEPFVDCIKNTEDDGSVSYTSYGWECVKATDGNYYTFTFDNKCDNGCTEDKLCK